MADPTVRVVVTKEAPQGFHLDDYEGTDVERWDQAEADSKAATDRNMPPVILPHRPIAFVRPRRIFSGQKVIRLGELGQQSPEVAGGNYTGPELLLGGTVGLAGMSAFFSPGGELYNVHLSGFSVQGSQGSAKHQFLDVPSGTLYASTLDNIGLNFMAGGVGSDTRKALLTQVRLGGMWTFNNAWGCQLNPGGSDCDLFPDGIANIGTSQASVQTGGPAKYLVRFDSLEARVGKMYVTALNGWRGVLISGAGTTIDFHGSIVEGWKPTRVNGLLGGPAPGVLVRQTGGVATWHGAKIGQGMDNPDASEAALYHLDGGEASMFGVTFYGRNLGSVPAVRSAAGTRLTMKGTHRRLNSEETSAWSGRPRVVAGGYSDLDAA